MQPQFHNAVTTEHGGIAENEDGVRRTLFKRRIIPQIRKLVLAKHQRIITVHTFVDGQHERIDAIAKDSGGTRDRVIIGAGSCVGRIAPLVAVASLRNNSVPQY